jgi:hypothetical protein
MWNSYRSIRLDLYAPTGKVIARFEVNSRIYAEHLDEETVTRGLRVAMRNAAARFLVEFHSRLDVRIWLADLGFTEPLAQVSLPRPHSQLM